ncbi:hypothetical protein Ccrd_018745 [Cynara cardunculus var. scolymus]|uniref:Uncharacterized protein n=1 Tax=Cynara cardunculus var. scolymus TaxID=59895 RepID=A0A103Y5L7_CYNCS|nr:hypothetical protein Ccrd_018745 [Cynara cardunculus var. scolymus]
MAGKTTETGVLLENCVGNSDRACGTVGGGGIFVPMLTSDKGCRRRTTYPLERSSTNSSFEESRKIKKRRRRSYKLRRTR